MKSIVKRKIKRFSNLEFGTFSDDIVVEEPLEIFINANKEAFLVTMRTPGQDELLATGLLFTLEIIQNISDVLQIKNRSQDQLSVNLNKTISTKPKRLLMHSSCGLCNSTSWDDISSHSIFPIFDKTLEVEVHMILDALSSLEADADIFSYTGGNHKVAAINLNGDLIFAAEDVGRHNAFDKVVGYCLIEQLLPLKDCMVVLSGRCSYEMCLKAWQVGAPIVISKGAPTSKAIELADNAGITLIGFAKSKSFNIYTHSYRIKDER